MATAALGTLARAARAWHRRHRPFFLGVGFHHPHTKWRVPRQLWARAARRDVAPPDAARRTEGAPAFAFGDINLRNFAVTLDDARHAVPQRPWADRARLAAAAAVELRRGYLAAVAFADQQVGRMLDGLEHERVDNDTVVVFTSDHGYGLGERGHWGKGSLYEIDARVPLIIRDPAAPEASRAGLTSKISRVVAAV